MEGWLNGLVFEVDTKETRSCSTSCSILGGHPRRLAGFLAGCGQERGQNRPQLYEVKYAMARVFSYISGVLCKIMISIVSVPHAINGSYGSVRSSPSDFQGHVISAHVHWNCRNQDHNLL